MKTLLCVAIAAIGCQSSSDVQKPVPEPASSAPPPAAAASGSPQSELDALDGRRPVPLMPMMAHHQKQNMRDHLLAVQEIVTALASDDFAGVEKASLRIGSSPEMQRMCNHMGAGAPGFTPQALEFHSTADSIASAAKKKDKAEVLRALGSTLGKCNGCHSAFKQNVVSAEAFRAATDTSH